MVASAEDNSPFESASYAGAYLPSISYVHSPRKYMTYISSHAAGSGNSTVGNPHASSSAPVTCGGLAVAPVIHPERRPSPLVKFAQSGSMDSMLVTDTTLAEHAGG
jgi:hypothetical protein